MLKIALLQMTSKGMDQKSNQEKGELFCRQACTMGADIALFPEMWNIGYQPYDQKVFNDNFDPADPEYIEKRQAWQQHAINLDSKFIQHTVLKSLAMTNYAAPQENGHSLAYDCIAFDDDGSRDMLVIEAGEGEGVYLANVDLEKLRGYRSKESWGNAYRKRQSYLLLTHLDISPPFVRKNARR